MTELAQTGQVNIGTNPSLVVPRNNRLNGLIITNAGSVTAYVSNKNDVSASSGYALLPGLSLVTTMNEAWYAVSTGLGTVLSFIYDCE